MVRDLTAPAIEGAASRRHAGAAEGRDYYLEGRYHWKDCTPGSIRDSAACFAKAVETDPRYGAAWAALVEASIVSSVFGLADTERERIRDAAEKAAALSPSLPEAHVDVGSVLALLDWKWAAAEVELEKAIHLDGRDPVAHIARGILLACQGRLDEATAQVERALDNDPASLSANFVLGWLYSISNRLDEAIGQHLLVSRLAPDYALPRLGLGLAYLGKGAYTDAIAHLTNALQMKCHGMVHGLMGYCYARAGRKEEALGELASLEQQTASQFVSPVSFAVIHAGLNDTEKALAYLAKAAEARDVSLPLRILGPEFAALRGDPRFEEIRARIGTAEQQ